MSDSSHHATAGVSPEQDHAPRDAKGGGPGAPRGRFIVFLCNLYREWEEHQCSSEDSE